MVEDESLHFLPSFLPRCLPSLSSVLLFLFYALSDLFKLHQRSRSSPPSTIPLIYAIRQPSRMRHQPFLYTPSGSLSHTQSTADLPALLRSPYFLSPADVVIFLTAAIYSRQYVAAITLICSCCHIQRFILSNTLIFEPAFCFDI